MINVPDSHLRDAGTVRSTPPIRPSTQVYPVSIAQGTGSGQLDGSAPEPSDGVYRGLLAELADTLPRATEENRLDTFETNRALEVRHRALMFVTAALRLAHLSSRDRALAPLTRKEHCVQSLTNQFGARMITPLLCPSFEEAVRGFRELTAHTVDEELVVLLNDNQLHDLHQRLHYFLESVANEIDEAVSTRLDPNPRVGAIALNDLIEFRGLNSERCLDAIRRNGLQLAVQESGLDEVKCAVSAADATGGLPLTETLKNQRVMVVNGFGDAKVSLAVHDALDHAWFFEALLRDGQLERYSEMFDSIGDPANTDIYKREGEIVASIAFGVRYWSVVQRGFRPAWTADDLLRRFDTLFDNATLESRHLDAYRLLRRLQPYSMEWQSLGFSFSNYLAELEEQRRKHGRIKQRDPITKGIVGELDPMGPDYLSFFVEAHSLIMSSKQKHRDDLFRIHILLEEYLDQVGRSAVPLDEPLVVRLESLRTMDFDQTVLDAPRLRWMFRNHGFSATREPLAGVY